MTQHSGAPAAGGSFEDFVEAVHRVVEDIPPGRVMSYGQVAAAFGSRSARGVGRVMGRFSDGLPWWRVVRSDGRAPQGHGPEALERYTEEGTPHRVVAGEPRLLPSAFL